MATDYFWTDPGQASERLRGSIILYDNIPVMVAEIVDDGDDTGPKARVFRCDDTNQKLVRKQLNSPKFERFRKLPTLGFMNRLSDGVLLLLSRRVVSTRIHGLYEGNTIQTSLQNLRVTGAGNLSTATWSDPGFTHMHLGQYPSMKSIITNLKPSSSMAYSREYAIVRDIEGFRWLYRLDQKVGLITDANTLMLSPKFQYLREEIQADRAFTLNNIVEF